MIFPTYFDLSEVTEPSKTLHRWCAVSLIAGVVGNNLYVRHGNTKLYPNLYIVLLGTLSSKYPAAIDLLKSVYASSSREVIIGDAKAIWAALESKQPQDKIIEAKLDDKQPDLATFTNGISLVNKDLEILQNGWNHEGFLEALGSKNRPVSFINPRLNLLLSCTPDLFASVFPSNNVNTHLLSQLLVVNGGNPRKKIAWPLPYDAILLKRMRDDLAKLAGMNGEMTISHEAKELLTIMYNNWVPIADSRLMAYASNRHIQLIKLTMILAASKYSMAISKADVFEAAKILQFAESQMPIALGEYGVDKQSHIRGRIMHLLNSRFPETSSLGDIYKAVQQDVKNFTEAADMVHALVMAGKIVGSNKTFAPVNQLAYFDKHSMSLDYSTLWEGTP
jgi:hypothetical protein